MKHPLETTRLSCGQQALWYLNQLEPASTAYHLGICLQLGGPVDETALAWAWADIGRAHMQLRARFILRGDEPFIHLDSSPAPLRIESGGAENLDRLWLETAGRPFALDMEAPVRALLLRDSTGPAHLLLCAHHIVTDLWSSGIILRELSAAYQRRVLGQTTPVVSRAKMEYAEFVEAERRWLEGPEGRAAWNFWRRHLHGLRLEPMLTRRAGDGKSGQIPIALQEDEARLVRHAARENATTPHAVLLACHARLLGEETVRDELVIGTPATIRNRAALRDTVGYLVNAVPVRCPVGMGGGNPVGAVAANARLALKQRSFPFPTLVERLGIPRIPGTTPVFQSMFSYQSLPRADRNFFPSVPGTDDAQWEFGGGITARNVARPAFDAQFPISLAIGPEEERFVGSLQYDGCCVTAADANRLAARFPGLVREFLTLRKPKLHLTAPEDGGERLEHLFDETVRRMPDATATSENGVNLSYAEAQVKAEAFVAGLNEALQGCERPVAVQMASCTEALIIILAILKSGRAFVPVDMGEPASRRNAVLLRTGAGALVSASNLDPDELPEGVMALHPGKLRISRSSAGCIANPSRTAYLIHTSGSTGEPKAVEVEHAAVINHARAMARIFGLTPRDRVLQFHTLAFDAAFEEIFPGWIAGAGIVFDPQARNLSIPAFLEVVARNEVTVLNLPTSYWHLLTADAARLHLRLPANVRLLVVGGEQACAHAYSAWRKLAPDCRWINTYGPTESTITALSYEPPPGVALHGVIPIGKPIDGVVALLLNAAGETMSSGTGELLLGGKGLALGYRGDPKTTAVKFVSRVVSGTVQRLHRTGDRVRLRRDGNFEYLGRLDRQVKIRGHRVDPDEIERVLRAHPAVLDAVVAPKQNRGELDLTAWVLRRANESLTEPELRAHLLGHFPVQLVPSRLIFVKRMPRKPNGKPDMAALAGVQKLRRGCGDDGSLEMAALFGKLLGRKIGPEDDFFLAGGHSLLAIKLLGRVEAQFGARISVSDFAASPTAKGLWQRLQATPVSDSPASPEAMPLELPVSAQQKRALLAHEIGRPSVANIVLLLRIDGPLDEGAFRRALETVARKHFLLRAGFLQTEAGIVLRETEPPRLECRTLRDHDFKNAVIKLARAEGSKPFTLDGRKPWIRLLLASARGARNRHLILITHHAVADGWAFDLLLGDLHATYRQTGLESGGKLEPSDDFRAHAVQQARWLEGSAAQEQILFWKKRLSGAQESRLPFRLPSSSDVSWRIERHEMTLPLGLSRGLRKVAVAYGTTPFALAMACFKAQLHRHGGQSDITLGTVVSNRSSRADQGIFGPLQNPVLIRDEVTANLSMRGLAQRVGLSLAEAQENGTLPFEYVSREALRGSLPAQERGIQFLSRDRDARTLRLGTATVRPVDMPFEESPFELGIGVSAAATRVKIAFGYRRAAYAASGIKRLARQYAALLQAVVDSPDATIAELNMIPEDERRRLQRRVSRRHVPHAELLHQGFESQVRRNPNAPALVSRECRLTYGELDSKALATAQVLVEGGLKKKGLVAVMLPKGWEQVVACLAVLKAGGVYVPLDPALPEAHLNTIFEQGGFHAAIVAEAELAAPWAKHFRTLVTMHCRPRRAPKLQSLRIKPDSLAYIIFTSGTTGVPKGVMISHQAAMTTIAEINRRFQVRQNDHVLAVSAPGFDLSVFDIFGTLRAGGTIVMPGGHDPKEWVGQAVAEKVTVWNSVPCLFELLLDEAAARGVRLKTLRLVMLSGDFTPLGLARRAQAALPRARLVSLGGATEGAIWSIAREVEEIDPAWHRIPYGRALRQQEMFVLDGALNHCPAGVAGELFIAGAGLAKGYWRNGPETKRRFLRHPRWDIRLYRTGDQGRYLDNGEIESLGRLDGQVKVNGVRIELGEVEAAFCSIRSVRQAVAEIRIDAAGNKNLVAFVAAKPGTSGTALLAQARKTLPAPLIPSACVVLDRLPLTSNGKVDRAALHAMSLPVRANSMKPPENVVERWIAGLWGELLGGIIPGVEDDFFALGGHSLLAIRMLQRVRSHFGIDLPISLIVEHPTVRGLAAAVNAAESFVQQTGLPERATAEFERDSEPAVLEPVRRTNKAGAILLTGATGHLGSALLNELLRKTSAPIYCLVRSNSKEEAETRLAKVLQTGKNKKVLPLRIVAVPADLSRERFGLEAAAFENLAMAVGTIYHCAAEVNFIAPYEKLAPGNVGGVREIIRLAMAAGATLHHVSSVAVFPYDGSRVRREDEDISHIEKLAGGYAQSKWTSELMVWKAMERGLRAVIYRPAQIIGRAGVAPHDLFEHVFHACKILRAAPDIDVAMDMVTAEFAAAAIHALSMREASLGRAFHLVHPEPISLRKFVGLLPAAPEIVPLKSWLARLKQEARRRDDPSLHFVSLLAQGVNHAALTPPGFDCSGTTAGLRGTGISCPPLDQEFVGHGFGGSVGT